MCQAAALEDGVGLVRDESRQLVVGGGLGVRHGAGRMLLHRFSRPGPGSLMPPSVRTLSPDSFPKQQLRGQEPCPANQEPIVRRRSRPQATPVQ